MVLTLEELFLYQAESLHDVINRNQLKHLLRSDPGQCFNNQLCEEMVHHFGDGAVIDFEGFRVIWRNLVKRRSEFNLFSDGLYFLSPSSFRLALKITAGQEIPMLFFKQIMRFYNNVISFDSFIHALNHIHKISRQNDFSTCDNLADIYRGSIANFKDHPDFYFTGLGVTTTSLNFSTDGVRQLQQHFEQNGSDLDRQQNDVLNPEDNSDANSVISDAQSDISGFSLWYSRFFEDSNDFAFNAGNTYSSDFSSWDEDSLLQEEEDILESLL